MFSYQSDDISDNTVQASLITLTSNLSAPQALDGTDFGRLYIVERGKSRLLLTDTTGVRTDSLGNLGFGNYQFDQPVDVDVTNGLRIYIADQGNRRIQVLDRRHKYLTTIQPLPQSTEQPYEPLLVATNAFQEVFFYNGTTRRIVKINERGEESGAFGFNGRPFEEQPLDLTCNEEWLWVLDHTGMSLHTFSTGGNYVKFWKLQNQYSAVKWYDNTLWILGRDRISQYSVRGRVLRVIKFHIEDEPVDFARVNGSLYLLASHHLYKIH